MTPNEIPNPEGYPLASTWEDCARHVEKGGVVESKQAFEAEWYDANIPADSYRVMPGAPGRGSWIPHRLVPLPAEVELAELRARLDAVPEVPDGLWGCLDRTATALADLIRDSADPGTEALGALYEANAMLARRPKPEPETERVPWWEAAGREDRHDGRITSVEKPDDGPPRIYFDEGDNYWMDVLSDDGTVEVLR